MEQEIIQKNSVFISYNRRDLETVKTLTGDLEELGYSVWFDQALTGGQNWWDHILENIRKSEIFIFALTPNSLESEACLEEIGYANKLKKLILPVLLSDKVNVSRLPSALNEIQYIDSRQQDKDAFKRLVKAIKNLPTPNPLPDPLPEPPVIPVSYLSILQEKILATKTLSFEEQAAIVLDVKKRLNGNQSPEDLSEIQELLHRLRQRDDLLAKTADEIDLLFKKVIVNDTGHGAAIDQNRTRNDNYKDTNNQPEEPKKPEKIPPVESGSWTNEANNSVNQDVGAAINLKNAKQYKVFQHPSGLVEVVKQGWSWPAFFFGGLWALYKKLWAIGGALLGIAIFIQLIALDSYGEEAQAISAFGSIVSIVVSVVLGMNGNSWRESNLLSKGYQFKTTLSAATPEGAMALYLSSIKGARFE
ncbi:MAG: TIR domain-containing protein [Methylococcaceae bacterium]|nr:TIR domain-containing protein [Methylococcaceae bacterium]MDZ4155407.1 TIR domain-containing protein [Methylococcales bacterium]MDP2392959.1 TIR domain-containing protein [Methylococcaceae bacterium]MDP3018293.1 TIR domain-containing protein [Methylococcaceae bacterium]MDP3391607.1 TIR domain-containing protein [Methylococcaceae bacterium]